MTPPLPLCYRRCPCGCGAREGECEGEDEPIVCDEADPTDQEIAEARHGPGYDPRERLRRVKEGPE